MKKIYITPWLEIIPVAMESPLATSLEVHDDEMDSVISDSEDVLSRRKNPDVWGENDDDETSAEY